MGKSTLILPILLITVGAGWLLGNLGIAPQIDWIWTIGLAVIGISMFVFGGVNKVTIVLGPIFIMASLLSILRQNGRLELNIEIPILVICMGVLMLLARLPVFPMPAWLNEEKK